MTFLERVLEPPEYGFLREGRFYRPTSREIFKLFFKRLNVFADKKNWLALFSWASSLSFAIPITVFFVFFFSWPLLLAGLVYSMVVLGSHGTFWLHRYGTHRAFKFRANWIRDLCRNLVLKIIPEETYIVSHYVHHQFSEKPGDPYNVNGGWLYCFLADATHQAIRRDLDAKDYAHVCRLLEHTGVRLNSFSQYKRWGSACHPFWTVVHFGLNWAFWYLIFWNFGGHALATALFGFSGVWAIGVRTFNYDGHGRGKDRRQPGIDFNRDDLSVNQVWPGYVAGEWHNNHHLFPNGARSGFLPYQIDLPWYFIRGLAWVGGVSSYRDYRADFYRLHYLPYQAASSVAAPVLP